jgi:uncharacterized DUF497 family protein
MHVAVHRMESDPLLDACGSGPVSKPARHDRSVGDVAKMWSRSCVVSCRGNSEREDRRSIKGQFIQMEISVIVFVCIEHQWSFRLASKRCFLTLEIQSTSFDILDESSQHLSPRIQRLTVAVCLSYQTVFY